ncbi:MAG: DUF2617 family protein [Planctomycetes bacterium]|nr:DUF2617 family protein [Planctomycetota bacterium]
MNTGQNHCVDTLRFCLYDRPLHPELFDIRESRNVDRGVYEAQVWATGRTHAIGFFRTDCSLVEVIAGEDVELPARGLILELPFRGEKDHERKKAGDISYMMNFQVEIMSKQVYSGTHEELTRMAAKRGLFVLHAERPNGPLTPFTFIDYEARPNEFHVMAFHSFPDELTILKTQSIFELG